MRKAFLIVTLVLCASAYGSAKSKAKQEITEPAQKVELAAKDLTERMTSQLGGKNGKQKVQEFKKQHEQFLFEDSKIDDVLKAKTHQLDEVYKKLYKECRPTEFIVDGNNITVGKIAQKVEYKQKKNKVDTIVKNEVIVPIVFQAHTIAKDKVSDARYEVYMDWELNPNKKNSKPKLVGVKATPIEFTNTEKVQMQKAVQAAIADWYKNLSSNLDKKYTVNAINGQVKPMMVSADRIIVNKPIKKNMTVANVPEINVQLDPMAFISPDSLVYYTDPTANIIIKPEFEVAIDNSLTKATIKSVRYKDKLNTPVPDAVKSARISQAAQAVGSLYNGLSAYVGNKAPEAQTAIEAMFVSPNNLVAISNVTKGGKETIGNREVKDYLKRLNGLELNMINVDLLDAARTAKLNEAYPELNLAFDNNFNTIAFMVGQHYEGKNYKDNTSKVIVLENAGGKYMVNRIFVIPGSTELLD